EVISAVQRNGCVSGHRGALARAGDAEKPALLRPDDAQRKRVLPRVLLVLLHQRARAAVPEPALSAGLQHGAPALFLAVPPTVVLPVVAVFPGGVEAELPKTGPRLPRPAAGALLVRVYPRVLHVLDDAGILLDARVSGAGAAAGLSD